MKPLADCKLYTFVDTAYLGDRAPEVVAQQLCDGGSDLIQLRAKNVATDKILAMAEKIRTVTSCHGVGLVVNDRLDIARNVEAEFCHLGQEDFFGSDYRNVAELRTPFGGRKSAYELQVGLSTHSPEQGQRAVAAGADYIAIGPVYATGTKPTALPVTVDYVRWAAANVSIPWFAIGGITLQNLGEVLAAGAKRICVVSAILNAPDIAKACAAFKAKLK